MNKKLTLITVVAVMVCLLAAPAIAKGPKKDHPGKSNIHVTARVPNGPAGKSNIGHLYLYEKDLNTWEIFEGGAWGKMKYNLSGATFDFVFNGHGLPEGLSYTLIYYPDPWPGNGLICLGSGIVNGGGNIHIAGSVNAGDLPIATDQNANIDTVNGYDHTGAKIWLVPSGDVDCLQGKMVGWSTTVVPYLFEYDLITFDDTDE